jgi:hypothetical protein
MQVKEGSEAQMTIQSSKKQSHSQPSAPDQFWSQHEGAIEQKGILSRQYTHKKSQWLD